MAETLNTINIYNRKAEVTRARAVYRLHRKACWTRVPISSLPKLVLRTLKKQSHHYHSSRVLCQMSKSDIEPLVFDLFQAVSEGRLDPVDASSLVNERISNTMVAESCDSEGEISGESEVIWGESKSAEEISKEIKDMSSRQGEILTMKIEPSIYAGVRKILPGIKYHARAKMLTYKSPHVEKSYKLPGSIAIVTDATADRQITDECRLLLSSFGCYSYKVDNMSSSNINQILKSTKSFAFSSVVLVIYKNDIALPGVISGIIAAPVVSLSTEGEKRYDIPNVLSVPSRDSLTATKTISKILSMSQHTASLKKTQMDFEEVQQQDGATVKDLNEILKEAQKAATEADGILTMKENNIVSNEAKSIAKSGFDKF